MDSTNIDITSVEDIFPMEPPSSFRVAAMVYTSNPAGVVTALTEAAFSENEDLVTQLVSVGITYVQNSSECSGAVNAQAFPPDAAHQPAVLRCRPALCTSQVQGA